MPVVGTKAAASAQGFGEFTTVSGPATYIEDVFSTWLYTGTNTNPNTITNGIDLSTKGGLVWVKSRSTAKGHFLYDTARGAQKMLLTNSTAAQYNDGTGGATSGLYAFNTNGFTLGTDYFGEPNQSGANLVSWTFRKQPKFFDVVTWTGNGARSRDITHNLGAAPGFILVKNTSSASNWSCWHRSLGTNNYLLLNSTASNSTANINPSQGATYGGYVVTSNSTTFSLSIDDTATGDPTTGQNVNQNAATYVAYLFAHNAGGFGLTGTDNVISCGSFSGTGGGSTTTVTLGYEPQWVMVKCSSDANGWEMYDSMRGMVVGVSDKQLLANTSAAESTVARIEPTATGFIATDNPAAGTQTYIYIAIRRGPMKTPTTGTSVFAPVASGNNVTVSGTLGFTTNIVTDLLIRKGKGSGTNGFTTDRLRGGTAFVSTNLTNAEAGTLWNFASQTGVILDSTGNQSDLCGWAFRRAPGFFDEVCYTGTGVAGQTYSHNLGVKPQLMLVKSRSGATEWTVYSEPTAATKYLVLNQIASVQTSSTRWNDTEPTASLFTLGTTSNVNGSGSTYVAYLFATCPGVSKVGSYTGTGASRTIDCGFTGGARFVLIKRTDSTSGWYVWDTSRGMSSSTDPYLFLNNIDPQVSTTNWIDTASTGFSFTGAADDEVNLLNASYIFLAIA